MRKLLTFILIQIFVSGLLLNAQKITVQKGSLSFIKGQKTLLATFDYSNMAVGKFAKEDDYLADKAAAYNKDEAGRGDKWKASWKTDRASRFEPSFEELFNKYCSKIGLSTSSKATDAKFEINIHTLFTEPGFNIYVTRKPALINVIVTFKNISTGEEVCVLKIDKSPGNVMGMADYDTGSRIEQAYAKLGKSLAAYLVKQK
jgi:hypothetical protein